VAPDGTPAATVLDAIANMTKNPSNAVKKLFDLASNVYEPALTDLPASWLLFIKFTGGFYSNYDSTNLINGPGQVGIDERGYFWVNDNYVPVNPLPPNVDPADLLDNSQVDLSQYVACAGKRLLKFYPWGEPYAGMPIDTGYTGGGPEWRRLRHHARSARQRLGRKLRFRGTDLRLLSRNCSAT
jgi:hypothetical protein